MMVISVCAFKLQQRKQKVKDAGKYVDVQITLVSFEPLK
jgi:hypothetical protein